MAQEQRFELVSMLGRGGMAEVYLGWMNSVGGLKRKVAIKRILPELLQKQSKMFQRMFIDEARLAFQLEHDNVVRVYDVGQTSNTFFIVMEYIEGMDLKTIMEKMRERDTHIPMGIILYIMQQMCAGLGYAHKLTDADGKPLNLIHNDVSPPNILLGRHGEVKVSDFGLSDASGNSVATPDGMVKGKFAYISPESTSNPPEVTAQSDIFSLGIIFWEMLAGRRLFQRDSDLETFKAVKHCVVPDLRKYRPDVTPDLLNIVYTALAPNPKNRYKTAEQLYLDISAYATAMSIPLNRYDLCWLIDQLADKAWGEFVGEKVSKDVQADIERELDDMLPPGDAEMLKELVTGISVAVDVDDIVKQANETSKDNNWIEDVFEEVGFEKNEVVFKTSDNPVVSGDAEKSGDAAAVKSDAKAEQSTADTKNSDENSNPSPDSKISSDLKAVTLNSKSGIRGEKSGVSNPGKDILENLPSARTDARFTSSVRLREKSVMFTVRKQLQNQFIGAIGLGLLIGAGIIISIYKLFVL